MRWTATHIKYMQHETAPVLFVKSVFIFYYSGNRGGLRFKQVVENPGYCILTICIFLS